MKPLAETGSFFRRQVRKPWVIAVLAVVILIGFFILKGRGSSATSETVAVKRGTVSEEVSVTGKVKSAQSVALSFEQSGRVIKIARSVGDAVSAGDVIVEVDHAASYAELAQAQAALRVQQAKLNELEAGTRKEQSAISSAKASSTKTDLANAKQAYLTALENAYVAADDAVRGKVDVMFTNVRSGRPQLNFAVTVTTPTSIESGRSEVEDRLDSMQRYLDSASPNGDLMQIGGKVKQDLGSVKLFLDNLSIAVNALAANSYLTQTTVDAWKSAMSTARTNVNTAISNVLTSESKLVNAQSAASVASSEQAIDALDASIESQRAQVAQAAASVEAARSRYDKTFLRTPISGIVSKQESKLGETAIPNQLVATVMSDAQFEIEAFVPEADLARVRTGAEAVVTLDAYGSDALFQANVVSIEPAETVIDGVPTYKTVFQFAALDERIRSGMTANVDIRGESRSDALYVPQRAVSLKSGKKTVTVIAGKEPRIVEVTTGIRGADGSLEILSGLSEGDLVVVGGK